MKSIKVFYHGKRLRDIYPHATPFQVFKWKAMRFIRKLAIVTGSIATGIACLYGAYTAGSQFNPNTVYAEKQVEVTVDAPAPVMDRIAKCESGGIQEKNGQVLMVANANKSVDVGYYQINMSLWGPKAAALGYNLTKEADNKAFGMWLYRNYGTEPWYLSKACWNK